MVVLSVDMSVRVHRRLPARVLPRMATTGIYLVRTVPRDLQRAARARAVREGTTVRRVVRQGVRGSAAGTWTQNEMTGRPNASVTHAADAAGRRNLDDRMSVDLTAPGQRG